MKASLLSKLETLSERHEEVSALLGDAEIIADQNRFHDLSREYAELENVVRCYGEFAQVKSDLADAEQMLEDDDPELRQMAKDELDSGGARLAELERELQTLLLPRKLRRMLVILSRIVVVSVSSGTGLECFDNTDMHTATWIQQNL